VGSEEYVCVLRRYRTKIIGRDRWEAVTESFTIRFDLVSTPSRMNVLLAAISHHLRRDEDFRGREREIEQNDLQVVDAEGVNFETIYGTAEQLARHNEGCPASVEDGSQADR
jgi:hypothetical protein